MSLSSPLDSSLGGRSNKVMIFYNYWFIYMFFLTLGWEHENKNSTRQASTFLQRVSQSIHFCKFSTKFFRMREKPFVAFSLNFSPGLSGEINISLLFSSTWGHESAYFRVRGSSIGLSGVGLHVCSLWRALAMHRQRYIPTPVTLLPPLLQWITEFIVFFFLLFFSVLCFPWRRVWFSRLIWY